MRPIFACFICICLFFTTSCFEKNEKPQKTKEVILTNQPEKVLDFLTLSSNFLINHQNPNGFFKYEYDFITGSFTDLDNIIHQTKTGYALTEYYIFLIRNNIDAAQSSFVLEAIKKALKGYETASIQQNSMNGKLISFYYNRAKAPSFNRRKRDYTYSVSRLKAEIAATAFALITELNYWNATSDNSFENIRKEWANALIYHIENTLDETPAKAPFMPYAWQALTLYAKSNPNDNEIKELLKKVDNFFLTYPRPMQNDEDYTWDMIATNMRYQQTKDLAFANFASRQTTRLLERMYTRNDTTTNNCALALGLVEASFVLMGKDGGYARLEQTALGRSQLEYYSSLKYTLLPNQTWITLGPGRTLHSQDFKRFAGANIVSMHKPSTNIGMISNCLLAGMRFSNEDLKELESKRLAK